MGFGRVPDYRIKIKLLSYERLTGSKTCETSLNRISILVHNFSHRRLRKANSYSKGEGKIEGRKDGERE